MQDAIRYGAPALTIDEARALAARISDVIRQRDELLEEVTYWRQVMTELAALRAFLHDDAAGAMGVPAASNGHLAHAPTDVAGDTAPEPS